MDSERMTYVKEKIDRELNVVDMQQRVTDGLFARRYGDNLINCPERTVIKHIVADLHPETLSILDEELAQSATDSSADAVTGPLSGLRTWAEGDTSFRMQNTFGLDVRDQL